MFPKSMTMILLVLISFYGSIIAAELLRDDESTRSFCAPFKPGSEKCEIMLNLEQVQLGCGEICNTTIKPISAGKYYDVIRKSFDCIDLFENPFIDNRAAESIAGRSRPLAYQDLPKRIRDLYSYQGRVTVRDFYFNDAEQPSDQTVWTVNLINKYRMMARNGRPYSTYGSKDGLNVFRHLRDHMLDEVRGGNVLVIGSQTPWIEAMLIELGAAKVTTVDYTPIENHHPQIETLTPEELSRRFLSTPDFSFDGIVTFSSVEHSGLGRYGDALNPWGDLITMSKAWCLTKPGGKLLIGVPTGYDSIYFNAHRLYGPIQYSHLFANWNVVYTETKMFKDGIRTKEEDLPCTPMQMCYQPVHILQKDAAPVLI